MTRDIHADMETACRVLERQTSNSSRDGRSGPLTDKGGKPIKEPARREPGLTADEEAAVLHVLWWVLPMVLPMFFETERPDGV